MAVILAYELTREKERRIKELAEGLNIQVKTVPPSSYGETLGYLAGVSGFQRKGKGGETLGREMLVFSGMPGELLDSFLDRYRASGLLPVELKAMVTPHNVFWDSRQLFLELKEEHEQISR